MKTKLENWSLYIIEADDSSLYTGITTDVERRFNEHQQGRRGAKYFHGRDPVQIVYREDGHDHSSACKREAQIKRMTRSEKKILIGDVKAHRLLPIAET